ncbi:MAG TPA: hypothetical protein VF407_13410 [Polyangiaceae bacterium]
MIARPRLGLVVLALLGAACTRAHESTPPPVDVAITTARVASPTPPSSPTDAVTSPPAELVARLNLSPFYTQYVDEGGVPIVGSAKVSPYALLEARFVVDKMIGSRPDILRAIGANGVRLAIMDKTEMTTDVPEHATLVPAAYWNRRARGLGATAERPAMSAAEENLLELPGDPYWQESILVHEFAHVVHQRGMNVVDPTFDARLAAAYANARSKGLWDHTYAAENKEEYWAEATQSWFDTNRVNDNEHGPIDTRAKLEPYDPPIAALLTEVYGDGTWRFHKISQRGPDELGHLAGLDRAALGSFEWPPSAPPLGQGAPSSTLASIAVDAAPQTSVRSTTPTSIEFVNRRAKKIQIEWIDFAGQKKPYAMIEPGRSVVQATYVGHAWLVTEDAKPIASTVATATPGRFEIR